jgi:RNA polymerase sigma-70 factor (ECF subfamily)
MRNPPRVKTSAPSDEELIVMIKRGNAQAMETLIERYQKQVFNFALGMVGNRHSAEDITQETLIKVMKSLPTYRPKNFRGYIYRIANNTAYDLMRQRKMMVSFESKVMIADNETSELKNLLPDTATLSPEQTLMQAKTEEMLNGMLMRIPYEQRRVFIMREFSDMPFREIADVCGCSLNTVLSRMQYCVKKLKKMIEEKNGQMS